MLGNNDAFHWVNGPSGGILIAPSEMLGSLYNFTGTTKIIPVNFQYLIAGRLILNATSILRVDGQVVVI